jgi:hypothetical protein
MYENGKQYQGVYGGIQVTFTLENFTPQVVERFNQFLAKEAMEQMRKEKKYEFN